MRRALETTVLLALLACPLAAQDKAPSGTPPKEADVRRLMEVTGQAASVRQVVDSIMGSIKPMYPSVPESLWTDLAAEMRTDEFANLVVPIYMKYLTDEDVKGLLAFYEGPTGRKLIQVQPLILQDSMMVGRKWGEAAAARVIRRLQEKGYTGKLTGE
jgi:uncharacterized protein